MSTGCKPAFAASSRSAASFDTANGPGAPGGGGGRKGTVGEQNEVSSLGPQPQTLTWSAGYPCHSCCRGALPRSATRAPARCSRRLVLGCRCYCFRRAPTSSTMPPRVHARVSRASSLRMSFLPSRCLPDLGRCCPTRAIALRRSTFETKSRAISPPADVAPLVEELVPQDFSSERQSAHHTLSVQP